MTAPDGVSMLTVFGAVDVTSLQARALYDTVTGLPNRNLVRDRLSQALAHVRRTGSQTAVLFVDLDRFKTVNDNAGHRAGDRVLAEAARRIRAAARECDTVGRWSGDEFIVVCAELRTLGDAALVATRIRQACAEPFRVDDVVFVLGASVGLATSRTATDPQELLDRADAHMYIEKRARRKVATP